MAWNSFATPLIGKAVRAASRLAHGGGSAFPGKIVERIDPQFLARTLQQLPLGVVLVSGTNGKTTTTRMVASMLESLGLKVFTNPTGSNFTRGVVSSLLAEVSLGGKLDADHRRTGTRRSVRGAFRQTSATRLLPAAQRDARPARPFRRNRQYRTTAEQSRRSDHRNRSAQS